MKVIDAEEQRHRLERHAPHTNERALWIKNSDTVFLKESGNRHFFILNIHLDCFFITI